MNRMSQNSKRTIFLAGPMHNVPRKTALAWREKAKRMLEKNFNVLHAYRGREKKETMPDPKGFIARDKNDIFRSDILIVNDSYENASMIGTAMEVFFAYSLNKIILVFGNAHLNDKWFSYHSHIRVNTLEEACDLSIKLFKD